MTAPINLSEHRAARRNVRPPDMRDELADMRKLRRRRAEEEYGVRVDADGREVPVSRG